MSKSQATSGGSGGGGLGCLGFFIALALIAGVWMWSQGMDAREAASSAMVLSAEITGALCCLVVSGAVIGFALVAKRGW